MDCDILHVASLGMRLYAPNGATDLSRTRPEEEMNLVLLFECIVAFVFCHVDLCRIWTQSRERKLL